jgi:hypothetical protein
LSDIGGHLSGSKSGNASSLNGWLVLIPRWLAKYKLKVDNAGQNIHPAHVRYASRPVLNSLDFFFDVLDSLDQDSPLSRLYQAPLVPIRAGLLS